MASTAFNKEATISPSHARRQALKHAENEQAFQVISTFPLEKYFSMAERLADAFDDAMTAGHLDEAYRYGLRYCTFSLEALPNHAQYSSTSAAFLKKRNTATVNSILTKMEILVQRMDAEEILKQQQEEERRRQEEEERIRKAQKEEQARQREQEEKIRESAQAKLQAMMMQTSKEAEEEEEKKQQEHAEAMQSKKQQQEEEEQELERERQRIAQQAEALARQERLAHEEWETMKLLANELNEEREEAPQNKETKVLESATHEITTEGSRKSSFLSRLGSRFLGSTNKTTTTKQQDNDDTTESSRLANKEEETVPANNNSVSTEVAPAGSYRQQDEPTTKSATITNPTVAVLPPKETTHPTSPTVVSEEVKSQIEAASPTMMKRKPKHKEDETIALLQHTVQRQHVRLQETLERKIPSLLRQGKRHYKLGDKKAALACMKRKRKYDRNVEALKGGIFAMETQILLLESAVEHRQVTQVLKDASNVLESLQISTGQQEDVKDTMDSMNVTADSLALDHPTMTAEDEDELLRELHEYYADNEPTPSDALAGDNDELPALLSMPNVPPAEPEERKQEDSVNGLLKAILA